MDAPVLNTLVKCRFLSLSTNCIDKMVDLPNLRNLEILSLSRNNIKKISGLEQIGQSLKELWLSYNQLKKLQEREGQIESIEEKVHDTRTRTAGKDYLLNSYLKYLPEGQGGGDVSCGSDRSSFGDALESIPERLQEMLEALTKVYNLNEEIQKTEEKISDLKCQLDVSDKSIGPGLESARAELRELRGLNDACGKEIDQVIF